MDIILYGLGIKFYIYVWIFPEVKQFNYTVLWDDKERKEAMKLI